MGGGTNQKGDISDVHVSVATSPVQHSMILVTLTILKSNIVQKNHAYGLSCGDPRTRALFAASMSGLPNLTPTRGLLEMGQIEEGKTHERQI